MGGDTPMSMLERSCVTPITGAVLVLQLRHVHHRCSRAALRWCSRAPAGINALPESTDEGANTCVSTASSSSTHGNIPHLPSFVTTAVAPSIPALACSLPFRIRRRCRALPRGQSDCAVPMGSLPGLLWDVPVPQVRDGHHRRDLRCPGSAGAHRPDSSAGVGSSLPESQSPGVSFEEQPRTASLLLTGGRSVRATPTQNGRNRR